MLLLPLSIQYAVLHTKAVRRAGYKGNPLTLGVRLFEQILKQRSGVVLSQHEYDEIWKLVAYKDKKIRLAIPEMLAELANLKIIRLMLKNSHSYFYQVSDVAITPIKFTVIQLGEK